MTKTIFLLALLLLFLHSFAETHCCQDPVTVVYVLAADVDPKEFAKQHNIEHYRKLSKGQKNIHEFQVACADGYPGGHDALAIEMKQQSINTNVRKSTSIVDDLGIQRKRVLHPRDWTTQLWHLTGDSSNADAHVSQSWSRYGIQGDGVIVAIVDDGLAWDNIDLRERFSMQHSANYNSGGGNDPYPRYNRDSHGTAAAGIAAASGNNGPPFNHAPGCAFGVAPMAHLSGFFLEKK